MTQAHKTRGAIVVLKEECSEDVAWIHPEVMKMRFVVKEEILPGHIHVVSMDAPGVELPGFHDERFKTYHGPDLKDLQTRVDEVLHEAAERDLERTRKPNNTPKARKP